MDRRGYARVSLQRALNRRMLETGKISQNRYAIVERALLSQLTSRGGRAIVGEEEERAPWNC
ncbi:MAG: hypothetical protein LBH86_00050 [Oscillospiraceae bacterium]|jgi:hypothetical protein|nr:hypothetical protein [Oscillospiraceae bacterium]